MAEAGEGKATVVPELINRAAALQARVEKMSGTIHRNLITNRWLFISVSSEVTGYHCIVVAKNGVSGKFDPSCV